jgi:predicted transcriptional regulator
MVNRANALSIYVPRSKRERRPIARLVKLAEEKDRSVNYLIVDAILQYLDREEKKK